MVFDSKLDLVSTLYGSKFPIFFKIWKNNKLRKNGFFYAKPSIDKIDFILIYVIQKIKNWDF